MKIDFLYPLWDDFPRSYIDKAMDIVGSKLPQQLAARGHDVSLYTRVDAPRSTLERWRGSKIGSAGVEFRRLASSVDVFARMTVAARLRLRPVIGPLPPDWYAPGTSLFYQSGYGLAAGLGARLRRVDIVHVCVFDELVPTIRRLAPNSRIVLHMHDHKQAYRDERFTRRRLVAADAIVGVSDFSTNAVKQRFPELRDRCHTIWNAVDTPASSPGRTAAGRRLLYSGRLSPEKGVHTILEAFPLVLSRHPDAELVIVGPDSIPSVENADPSGHDPRLADLRHWYGDRGGYARRLRALLPDEARSRVRFVGPVDHAAIDSYVQEADVILFPSLWDEPFGLPVIEGMVQGKPVIATTVGAFPETVDDGVTGLLVPPGDALALATAINRLFDDERALLRMGDAARERARLFSWERSIERWENLYERLRELPPRKPSETADPSRQTLLPAE